MTRCTAVDSALSAAFSVGSAPRVVGLFRHGDVIRWRWRSPVLQRVLSSN